MEQDHTEDHDRLDTAVPRWCDIHERPTYATLHGAPWCDECAKTHALVQRYDEVHHG